MIDVHSHLYPRAYLDLLRRRTEVPLVLGEPGAERLASFPVPGVVRPTGQAIDSSFWEVEEKLAFMDANGIVQSVVSLGNPWLDAFDGPDSPELAHGINEELAGLESKTGGRVVGAGALPADSIASAVDAIRTIARTPTLYGIAGGPRICGRVLDDRELEPIWEAAAAAGLPYLLHPKGETALPDLGGHFASLPVAVGFPTETSIALARLVLGGVLERHPGLRVVAVHGGGTMPYLAGRLDNVWERDLRDKRPDEPRPSEVLARVYLDTLVYSARALRAAADLVGPEHLVFGTDHPWYDTVGEGPDSVFEGDELEQVGSGTARALFGLPSPRRATAV